jgi:hypothetical protein
MLEMVLCGILFKLTIRRSLIKEKPEINKHANKNIYHDSSVYVMYGLLIYWLFMMRFMELTSAMSPSLW